MKAFVRFLQRLRRCFSPVKPPDLPPKENSGPGTVHRELKRLATTATDKHERQTFEQQMDAFFLLYTRHLSTQYVTREKYHSLDWDSIQSPSASQVQLYPDLTTDFGAKRLQKLAVIKMCTHRNQGLQADAEIRDTMNAIELALEHLSHLNAIYGVSIPLILIEPFDGQLHISPDHQPRNVPLTRLKGSRFPRLHSEKLLPLPTSAGDRDSCWYSPGVGDMFDVLQQTGTLERLLEEGKDYVFVSDACDVGATVDETIFAHVCMSKLDFMLEVSDKDHDSPDILVDIAGQLRLFDTSQTPSRVRQFLHPGKRFKYQPTGSFWLSLSALSMKLDEGPLELDITPVQSVMDHTGTSAVQLEISAVSAIKHFARSQALVVPRARHLPIRTPADILILRSDMYTLQRGAFVPYEDESRLPDAPPPIIKLSEDCRTIEDLRRRFAQAPHMRDLEHLSVVGNVHFGRNVTLRGTVIVHAKVGERIEIPDGSVLENKLVVGDIRIEALK